MYQRRKERITYGKIIDGKAISKAIKDEVKQQVEEWKQQGITVTLAVIQVGSNQASTVYVNNKRRPASTRASVRFLMNCPRKPRRRSFFLL